MTGTLRLALILCLMLTSIGLGMARGTVHIGNQVVICTGQGVVIRVVPGAPGESKAHICPDMALSLLNATFTPDIVIERSIRLLRFEPVSKTTSFVSRSEVPANARAPPALSLLT